jgi:DnaJ domain
MAMFEFLKRIFRQSAVAQPVPDTPLDIPRLTTRFIAGNDLSPNETATVSGLVGDAAVGRYFELSSVIERAKADGDFVRAVCAARETYPLMPAVVGEMKKQYGRFDISTSHAVHSASTLMAVIGDREGIRELRDALTATPELHDWLPIAAAAETDTALAEAIMVAVLAEPGLKQSELKRRVDGDGRRLGTLAAWLEKGKRLRRVSQGATYMLYPPDFPLESLASDAAPATNDTGSTTSIMVPVHWHTKSRSAYRARPLSLENLPYIRLPKAPIAWQERYRTQSETIVDRTASVAAHDTTARASRTNLPRFTITGKGWTLTREESLPPKERPNPAYSQMFQTAGSTLWFDPAGRRVGFPSSPAVALTTDRAGAKLAERGLPYDVYRADVNANGSGMLFLSRDGILHGYTERLEPQLTESVADLPEYAAQAKRFGIEPHMLRNHIRCVALATDRSRSLITVVDEAWCYDMTTGQPLWGLRFPSKEGWTEIAGERSERVGASAEINAALRLMELTLPVSPEAITRQYRALAMRWHPDRNPQNPESTRRFQDLGAAMELLTGFDLSRLGSPEIERVTYQQILHRSSITLPDGRNVTLSMTMQVGGAFGADWIYAANFAHAGHSTFLAGYGGRVVEVDASGLPLRVYDIGAVPRHVAETQSHRYFLTDTRLYVLSEDQLVALVDVFAQGKLIAGNSGFGLLQPKQFQWFTPTGQPLGQVQTRDPIRRIYSGAAGLVVETRTHRAVVTGPPSWW